MLDFETATNDKNSACEIGLTFVENNTIVNTKSWLIKPPCYPQFNHTFTHGITALDVAYSPEFPAVWREVRPLIEGKLLFAHYASFDIGVLCDTLSHYGLEFPNLTYGCTRQIARIVFPRRISSESNDFSPYGLAALCKTHKIKFRHHRAGEDTRATAELALIMFDKGSVFSVEDIKTELGISLGGIKSTGARWNPRKDKFKQKSKATRKTTKKTTTPKETEEQREQRIRLEWERRREEQERQRRDDEKRRQEDAERKLKELWWKKEQERLEAEEAHRERERKKEEARKRKEEWQRWWQKVGTVMDKHENLLVVMISILFGLFLVLGIVGLQTNAKRIQSHRQAEQERLIAEQEERERLAIEQREREEAERLAAEQRRLEELERQREAEEQYAQGLAHDARQEYEEAVGWFRLAAEMGHVTAQIKLGDSYFYGRGVPKNEDEVMKWYSRAAEQGDAIAQFKLGWCYYEGTQIAKDDTEAIRWWEKARAQGHALDGMVMDILRRAENRR